MGMELTFTNIFKFFATISPLLLGFFMVMISLFNQDLKGLIYLSGILLATVFNVFLMNMIKSRKDVDAAASCSLIEMPFNMSLYNSPSMNSVFLSFTAMYLILPMVANNQINYPLIAFLLSLFSIDAINKFMNKCTSIGGIVIGLLSGAIYGTLWYTLFHATGNDSLLYFDETLSNRVYCARPKKQTFKCAVYKNGEVIKTL
jgi:hypothetical protein